MDLFSERVIAFIRLTGERAAWLEALDGLGGVWESSLPEFSPESLQPGVQVLVLVCGALLRPAIAKLEELKLRRPDVPIVLVSQLASEELVLEAWRAGARAFLRDPEDLDRLEPLLSHLLRAKRAQRRDALPPGIEKAVQRIHACYPERLTLDQLAEAASLSKYHFCRQFRRHMGAPPLEYLNRVRVDAAKRLLDLGEEQLAQISRKVGLGRVLHLHRVFRRLTGTSPGVYLETSRPRA